MKRLIALTLLLAGCVAPPTPTSTAPTEVPSVQPTTVAVEETQVPTEVPPPTEAPAAEPESAESPSSDLEPTERLFRIYMFHASFGESIKETAQSPDGDLGMMFVVAQMLTGIDEAFLLDWPDELAADVEIAQGQQNALKDILIKWEAEEIVAADVPALMEAVGIQPNTLAFIDKLRAQGVTDEDFKTWIERYQAANAESMPEN